MPENATILSVQVQPKRGWGSRGEICACGRFVDPHAPLQERRFLIYGTGQAIFGWEKNTSSWRRYNSTALSGTYLSISGRPIEMTQAVNKISSVEFQRELMKRRTESQVQAEITAYLRRSGRPYTSRMPRSA